ncbi:probably inactive copalyl diphosphate synthase 3-like isoform X2 [Salvia miltiorrhiza]|uniref:probably inactive copalyl diphosphate synthase 3-like isoform X2 n=1 Tax=Salvia miltiorrhiza TaxID=226208 RepID=UPI0025AC6EFF|nr:probably inactive copalyl diphosphate synthase 3-like isoform X2 [Salvia miltiorrhiza]
MYILSTRPIIFPFGNGCESISSSTQGRRLSSQNCSNRIWKNGRHEVPPHMNNYRSFWKDLTNAARRGKSKFPQVCSGNIDGIEVQPLNEIKYGLETPWYARLPRLDARFFIEHYSVDEVLIDKSLYRLTDKKKDTYIELAKLDYNKCREQHQLEWNQMQQWYEDCKLEDFGISKRNILEAHFFAVASIYEVERSGERVAWVKSQILAEILQTYYYIKQLPQSKSDHEIEFTTAFGTKIHVGGEGFKNVQRIITILFEALTQLKKNAQEKIVGDVSDDLLHEAWGGWLKKLGEGTGEEIQEVEVMVRSINICGGHILSKEVLSHHEYNTLSQLTNQICHHLLKLQNHKTIGVEKIDKEMQSLVQLVMQDSSNGMSKAMKQTFLVVAKTFYHRAYFSAQEIEQHISMILFQNVV